MVSTGWGWVHVLAALATWSISCDAGVAAQAQPADSRVVIWLEHPVVGAPEAGRAERERALRLELQARDFTLLESRPSDPSLPPEQVSAILIARTSVAAVFWLEADEERPVSWLVASVRGREDTARSPLPHPPDAIEPQLLAIAAASLIDQALRDAVLPSVAETAPERADVLAPPPAAPISRPPIRPLPEEAPADYFVQLGFVAGFARLTPGMEASSEPRDAELYIEGLPGMLFDDTSPWIPDADSFDDYEEVDSSGQVIVPAGTTPVSRACAADGIETRAPERPSKFCARLTEPGFSPVPALRLAVGRWLMPHLAVSAYYQWHFTIAPEEPLGSHAFGVQGEGLIFGRRGRGVALSLLSALAIGRNETPVPELRNGRTVHALAGLFLAKAGTSVRVAVSRRVAIVGSAAVGGRFPEGQIELDLGLAAEHGF